MMHDSEIIQLTDVSKVYPLDKKQSVTAVEGIDLAVEQGQFVIITGRSGSGKTTLLNLISGLTRPTSGKALFEQIELWRLRDAEQAGIRNSRIGFIFQFPSLLPSLTSLENVMLPAMVQEAGQRAEVKERATALLTEVGLADKVGALPRQLSAGQQQRVVIARSLINRPDVLLADEPTSNLDEKTEHEIMTLIQQIHQERGITILLVTHSSELSRYGNRWIQMANGAILV